MKHFLILLTLCLLIAGCDNSTGSAQDSGIPVPLDPFEQNLKLGRGINLGNMLEAPNEGDWGVFLRASYFEMIAAAGFNSVRIPIRWSAHTTEEAPYTIDEEFFERVDWAIDQALKNDLMVIINIHHYEEIFSQPAQERDKFLSIWTQISGRYEDKPAGLLFEILNEPHDKLTAELWNELLPQALDIIRQSNPNRTVVIGAAEWGGVPGLLKLEIPEDGNLIITVHYYEPFRFTHQGASWVDGADEWLGTTWNGTAAEHNAVSSHFQQIVDWAEGRGVPVNIGEFGAFSRADSPSRARWTSAIVHFALTHDMSFHYWEFASGFGIYDPNSGEWDMELLQALTDTE